MKNKHQFKASNDHFYIEEITLYGRRHTDEYTHIYIFADHDNRQYTAEISNAA